MFQSVLTILEYLDFKQYRITRIVDKLEFFIVIIQHLKLQRLFTILEFLDYKQYKITWIVYNSRIFGL